MIQIQQSKSKDGIIKVKYTLISIVRRLYKSIIKSMGWVFLADMLIALYRTTIKSKRWCLKVLFHCVDIAKVNAWLLYTRHCDQQKVPKKMQMPLLKFTSSITLALIKPGTYETPRSFDRPHSSIGQKAKGAN